MGHNTRNYDFVTDIEEIEVLSAKRADEFDGMRHMLQLDDDLDDEILDALALQISQSIIAQIDCTQCGNCCRKLYVYLNQADIDRLRKHSQTTSSEVRGQLIDYQGAQSNGEWARFHNRPCNFLIENKCIVYELRPDTCRAYPEFIPDFRWQLDDIIPGSAVCPIIYNVVSEFANIIDDLSAGHIKRFLKPSARDDAEATHTANPR
jgi:hypothetical protein